MVEISPAWPTLIAVGVLAPSPVAAQTSEAAPARAAVPTVPATTEIQTVPSERSMASPSRIEPVEEDYRIGPQDLLEIQVFGIEDLKREVRVNAQGHDRPAADRHGARRGPDAPGGRGADRRALGKDYLQNPEVSVFIKEFTSQRITVEGAVARPGIYPMKGQTTLLQAIALAGGQGQLADLTRSHAVPHGGGRATRLKFDVDKIRAAEAPDPLLQPDDVVVVKRSPARVALRDSLFGDIIGIFNPFNYMTLGRTSPRDARRRSQLRSARLRRRRPAHRAAGPARDRAVDAAVSGRRAAAPRTTTVHFRDLWHVVVKRKWSMIAFFLIVRGHRGGRDDDADADLPRRASR